MTVRVRDTESIHIRLPKSLLARIRVFAASTRRPFAFACDKLLTDAVDAWEREQARGSDYNRNSIHLDNEEETQS